MNELKTDLAQGRTKARMGYLLRLLFYKEKTPDFHQGLCSQWCPRPDLNRHGVLVRGILNPVRLPISPPGHSGDSYGTRIHGPLIKSQVLYQLS